MTNPGRDELGALVTRVHRPTYSTRKLMFGALLAYVVIALAVLFGPASEQSGTLQIAGSLLAAAAAVGVLLVIVSAHGTVRIHERGIESGGDRMLWRKMVGFRLGWNLFGAQTILLVEQSTRREVPVLLDVFKSAGFQEAARPYKDLDTLVKVGDP